MSLAGSSETTWIVMLLSIALFLVFVGKVSILSLNALSLCLDPIHNAFCVIHQALHLPFSSSLEALQERSGP